MPIADLVNEVSSVLRMIPGVELRHTLAHGTHCQFDVTLDSWDALLLLAHAASGANVPFSAYSVHKPGSPEAASNAARAVAHQFLIQSTDEQAHRESLEMLGAHLVWNMHRLQWISTEDANKALRLFQAAPVPRAVP